MAKDTMPDVQSYLTGLDFPASKQTIISYAKDKKAPHEVVTALNGISDRDYMDADDVMKEMESK